MADTYQFTWDEVETIEVATALGRKLLGAVDHAHIETQSFDLDMDQIGVRITIPHDPGQPPDIKRL